MKVLIIALGLAFSLGVAAHEVDYDISDYASSIENLPNGDIVAHVPKVPNIKYISAESDASGVCFVLYRFKSAVETSIATPAINNFNDLYRVDENANMFLVKQVKGSDGLPTYKLIDRITCTNRY